MTGALRNGNGKIDFLKVVQVAAPLLILAAIGWMFLMGLVQTPEVKAVQSKAIADEVLEGHANLAGHPVMVERVRSITDDIDELKVIVLGNAKILSRIEAKMEKQ